MTQDKDRWKCKSCNLIYHGHALLRAPNPFDATDEIVGCPHCRSIEGFHDICDEAGCEQEVSTGEPTEIGYRRVCHIHSEWYKKRQAERIPEPKEGE